MGSIAPTLVGECDQLALERVRTHPRGGVERGPSVDARTAVSVPEATGLVLLVQTLARVPRLITTKPRPKNFFASERFRLAVQGRTAS